MQISLMCFICKTNRAVTDPESGEVICGNCGTVISDRIQDTDRPEWRAYSAEQEKGRSRTGIPVSLARADMGLATTIGKSNRDASGRLLDAAMCNRMQRLRTWDLRTRSHTSSDRNLLQAFNELDILKDKLGLKVPNADPIKCIVKVANKVDLTENTKRQAISIMKEV